MQVFIFVVATVCGGFCVRKMRSIDFQCRKLLSQIVEAQDAYSRNSGGSVGSRMASTQFAAANLQFRLEDEYDHFDYQAGKYFLGLVGSLALGVLTLGFLLRDLLS